MITYAQYCRGDATHHTYYGQFVNSDTLLRVGRSIGVIRIANATPPHFPEIPLVEWETLVRGGLPMRHQFAEVGDRNPTPAKLIHVAKVAADIIRGASCAA